MCDNRYDMCDSRYEFSWEITDDDDKLIAARCLIYSDLRECVKDYVSFNVEENAIGRNGSWCYSCVTLGGMTVLEKWFDIDVTEKEPALEFSGIMDWEVDILKEWWPNIKD